MGQVQWDRFRLLNFLLQKYFAKNISKVDECQVNLWKYVHNPQWPPQVTPKILKI